MNTALSVGTRSAKRKKRPWPGRFVMEFGPLLALIIYLVLIEQYGLALLDATGDQQVFEVDP